MKNKILILKLFIYLYSSLLYLPITMKSQTDLFNLDSLYQESIQKIGEEKYEESIYGFLRIINSKELQKSPESAQIAVNVNKRIGFVFMLLDNFTIAKYYFNEAIFIAMDIQANTEVGLCSEYIAICNYNLKKYEEVCDYLYAAILSLGSENISEFSLSIAAELCLDD